MAPRATSEQVEQAARLSGLDLEPGELELYRRQLGQLLAHMERLGRITSTGQQLAGEHGGAPACPLREDRPEGSPLARAILERAPALEADAFVVPRQPRASESSGSHEPE